MTDPSQLLRPQRTITAMSAILLVHSDEHTVDWAATEAHVARTAAAGLTPAVNMDTGYIQMLDHTTRNRVLDMTAAVTGGNFVAGAFVADQPGDQFNLAAHAEVLAEITSRGGTPVIFPSYGACGHDDSTWIEAHRQVAKLLDRFIGFELGQMFVPYGRVVALETYEALMAIPECVGAKHSSLDRSLEWDRLRLRNRVRPDFKVFTGNDLAIDMVMYGSDYLLGLSTFAPDLFAARDQLWADGDEGFSALNDLLQYLGHFTFRPPVPAYRHAAAMFLQLRGWATSDAVPLGAPRRPESDRAVLADIAERLGVLA